MDSKGFFCFLLLLAFIAIELELLAGFGDAGNEVAEATAPAFEAEKLALVRSLLEESVDSVVEEGLREGLLLELGPEGIKVGVNERLALLFSEAGKAYGFVEFEAVSKSPAFLNENSSVIVSRLGKKSIQAEYHFSGGVMKSNFVLVRIQGRQSVAEFMVPAGYTASATVVG
jgi:hypothetical protein